MPIQILARTISRMSVVDDQEQVRAVYEFVLDDLKVEAVSEAGPFQSLAKCVEDIRKRSDAAICDLNLKVRDYSTFNGAELVAAFYKTAFPAVLCTKWYSASIDEMRPFRRFIPSLVEPEKLDTTSITAGIESCIREFEGKFLAARRPWRTLVRVEDIRPVGQGANFLFVIVPAWNSNQVVKLPAEIVPAPILKELKAGVRLHAKVNLGANSNEELFFEEWEK